MKRICSMILTAVLLLAALSLPVSAARVSEAEAIEALETLKLVRGTGNGFEPERRACRAEAVVMLLRLLGREAEALRETSACPFTDGGWAETYLAYAQKTGLVKGISETVFGSAEPVDVRDYLTMMLRALGYSDSGEDADFSWAQSIAFADGIGLTHGEYRAADPFLRADMALVSYTALTLPLKGTEETLIRRLYLDGAVSASDLKKTRLAFAADSGEMQQLDAAEIHELAASAVIFVEVYDTEENFRKDKSSAHGSGFFVTEDGVAVLCCHELDGYCRARATTLDGRCYEIISVLDYDPLWDTAVVRVSRTDTEGRTVRFFPYLDLGDSDDMYGGEKIYTVSNPLGCIDCVSEGLVANRSQLVDDPDYRMIQITAPISQGSSGGPVLNAYGRVEGIVYGTFVNGQNMNLAIPVNQIDVSCFRNAGISVQKMLETENKKKASATLTASEETLYLQYEEEAEILITSDYPGTPIIKYEITEGADVVSCEWGSFATKQSVPLFITGIGNGEAEITVSYSDVEDNDFSVTIRVTVTGAPETDEPEHGRELIL